MPVGPPTLRSEQTFPHHTRLHLGRCLDLTALCPRSEISRGPGDTEQHSPV